MLLWFRASLYGKGSIQGGKLLPVSADVLCLLPIIDAAQMPNCCPKRRVTEHPLIGKVGHGHDERCLPRWFESMRGGKLIQPNNCEAKMGDEEIEGQVQDNRDTCWGFYG